MSQELQRDPTDRFDMNAILASGYDELTRVDQALRDAERRLEAAHAACIAHRPRLAREAYEEVVALRGKSRLMLATLGDMWVGRR
jgi:hypothetical protein